MYSNIAFAITLLGIFSIFELLKGYQKFILIKYHFLARLILLTAGSFFDYLVLADYVFGFLGSQINFWSATSISATIAGISYLTSGAGNLVRTDAPKKYGYSVRCVRD